MSPFLIPSVPFILIFLVSISLPARNLVDWFIGGIANVGFVLFGNFSDISRSRFNVNVCVRRPDGLWPFVGLSVDRVILIEIDLLADRTDAFNIG
jgi:hypothetical protein